MIKKTTLSLCLSLLLCSAAPAFAQNTTPTDVASAPSISHESLRALSWLPIVPPATQTIKLSEGQSQLQQGNISGPVATIALPADRGALEVTIGSLVENNRVFVPNVLVFDEQLRPAAFYPSSSFPYEKAGILTTDRLEGVLKLTPALGQKQIYLMIYTTTQDLAGSTTLLDPAKAYAIGVGNAVPEIPDPVAKHVRSGTLKVKVKAEQNVGNVMIGQPVSAPAAQPQPVIVGSSTAPVAASSSYAASAPASVPSTRTASPMLKETEDYFNHSINQALKEGDVDKALKLLNEAERLGSSTARKTFISGVKGKK